MNYTQEQIEKQFDLLPEEIQDKLFTPEIESKVQKIGVSAGLPTNQLKKLNALVNFVILGLTAENEFAAECQKAFTIEAKDAEELSQIISREIFAPIEAVKINAAEEQARYETEGVNIADLAPDNLPTGETTESFLPKLTPKIMTPAPVGQEAVHPFEEKMQEFFTAGQQPVSTTVTESARQNSPQENPSEQVIPQTFTPVAPAIESPKASPVSTSNTDPYREAIE